MSSTTKAILLAAGLGTRLRPLTLATPKPLLPLGRGLLIDHQLEYLKQSGITEVAINLHHLGDKIRKHVGNGAKYGLKVHYSEEPKILGTGGGIKKACRLLHAETFVALNCDALIDADIASVVSEHLRKKADATMVVKKLSADNNFNPVNVNSGGLVTEFGAGDFFYTGLQIIGPKLVEILPEEGTPACLIKDGYMKLLANSARVAAYIHQGYANDLGTPEGYEKAKRDIGRFSLR